MKPVLSLSIFLLLLINLTNSFPSKHLFKKKISLKHLSSSYQKRILESSDIESGGYNGTETVLPHSGSGLSTGGIIGIAIPCIAALVGAGAAAAILGGGGAAAGGAPVLANPVVNLPPPNYIDTSVAQLTVPDVPVQPPQIVQPPVEIPPQPVQQIVPITKVEPPVIQHVVPQQPIQPIQPVVQPQMVPVQQMELVPIQQVEMVPVQHIEMVPVQQVVPTYQAGEVIPQITQVSEIPEVSQISGVQAIQGVQGIQGGEFVTAPEGYGSSVVQGGISSVNPIEFSSNNLI